MLKIFINVFLVSLLLVLFSLPSPAWQRSDKILYQGDSLYQHIAVVENTSKKERYIFNKKRDYMQGGIYVDYPEKLLFEYTQMSFIGLAFLDREPEQVLFVGLGAGAMPRYFNKYFPDAYSDVVEIDPDIMTVAGKYFYFREKENMRVHINDGRVFIKRTPKKYDIIFLDAYQTDYIPFHLTTREFLKEVKNRLKDGGVVVSNIVAPTKNKFFYSMIKTYKTEFPHLYIFKGRKSQNFIFVATASGVKKEEGHIYKRAKKIESVRKLDIDLRQVSQYYAYYTEYELEAKVLTDDFAPVNLYKYMNVE
ncbi:MAG: fused MFS/spermidine synthase [Nitrospirota bacterium]